MALITANGSRPHRVAGNIFFVSMLVMAMAGIYIALILPMAISVLAGLITIYLVCTSRSAAKRTDGAITLADYLASTLILFVVIGAIAAGFEAQNSPTGLTDGLPAAPHFFFAGLATLLAMGDIVMIARKKITGRQPIARHLWRMCLAYFIANGSLFTGPGAAPFPKSVRDSGILDIPEPLVLLVMIFWVIRVLATKWYGDKPATSSISPNPAS
ncbi:hypothetical protein [uncultured Parasphingorhabdus sp.]|uniref:hypothetical protein n=1 Tax=uncultured Parasphingorhabdus sp. TaxID=2709694 RepID=UPI002AA86FFC|nr:hypothetical protein [uncultured Parasphingorhabdus sp.]